MKGDVIQHVKTPKGKAEKTLEGFFRQRTCTNNI